MLLEDKKMSDHLLKLGLTRKGIEYVNRVRKSPPAKSVDMGGGNNNVFCRYPSSKMGHTIQARSHTVILPTLYMYEFDENVLEYWDQPEPIKVEYLTKSNRKTASFRQPDTLAIYREKVVLVEWLTEKDLAYRVKNSPSLYVQIDGVWHSPPTEEALSELGIDYQIRTDSEINPILVRNTEYLESYWRKKPVVKESSRVEVQTIIKEKIGISLLDLQNKVQIATTDDINALIAERAIFVDIELMILAEPAQTYLFPDSETAAIYSLATKSDFAPNIKSPRFVSAEPGAEVDWDGKVWQILNTGEISVTMIDSNDRSIEIPNNAFEHFINEGRITGVESIQPKPPRFDEGLEILRSASPTTKQKALKRYYILQKNEVGSEYSPRTLRDWRRREQAAVQMYGNGFIGLIDKNYKKGNYEQKLPDPIIELMEELIESSYENFTRSNIKSLYRKLQVACEKVGLTPPSETTLKKKIKARQTYNQTRAREGSRAAYNDEPFYWTLDYRNPPHGDFGFQIVHIDHTQIELVIIDSETGEALGRLYLTLAIDAYSRRIVGHYLSFFPPSYESCMMVLRDVVRRHGRFPKTIVIDRGPEFKSTDMETLLAFYGCTLLRRPTAKARFGSIIERLFGTTQEQFFHNLKGRTYGLENSRLTTKENDPYKLAVWSFKEFAERMEQYSYQIYNNAEHSTLKMSPQNKYELGIQRTGERAHDRIGFTEEFIIMTCPTTTKGTAKVQKNTGVKILYFYYWCDAFRHPDVEGTQVPIRYDPNNRAIAYAYVKKTWRKCTSSFYSILNGKTHREIALTSKKLRQIAKNSKQKQSISDRQLADFLLVLENDEEMLELRKRQAQMGIGRQSVAVNVENPLIGSAPGTQSKDTSFMDFDEDDEDYSYLTPFEDL